MKREHLLLLSLAATVVLGCGSEEPTVTETDKANLERLHKEGIGKVMSDQAAKDKSSVPSLANPDGGPGPEAKGP
jgi:hypothetical protein